MMFDISNDLVLPLIFVASPTSQVMVSADRPKTRHRGWKTFNTVLLVRFRTHDLSSTRHRAGARSTLSSALHQVHHCRWHYGNVKSYALHAWKGGFLSQFKSKAREPSSSAPKPFTLQHLQTADPDLPTASQSHHGWSTSEAQVPNSCRRQQGWSARTCRCRGLAQCVRCLALCCTAIHLSGN